MNRRDFLLTSGLYSSIGWMSFTPPSGFLSQKKKIQITGVASACEREPLVRPFGFKGGYLTELWQTVAGLTSHHHDLAVGLGTQSVLWSDAGVFAANPENKGNSMMYTITQRALAMINGQSFTDPVSFLDDLITDLYPYGKRITGKADLRRTFILNALVPVDNALWLLYSREHGIKNFDNLIPSYYKQALPCHHEELAVIPLINYNTPVDEIQKNAREGVFFFKIKIGQPGTQQEMLEKDKSRLSEVHKAIGSFQTPFTKCGKVLYYLDANGRYESKQTLQRFIEHAQKIKALDQIVFIEEPYPEEMSIDVSDLGVNIAADESAHSEADATERIQMGYRAFTLKPVAKTLSVTLKMLKIANDYQIPCFCADLTVNPVLVEWNKNVAARLSPLPDVKIGLLETNGDQNYKNWNRMCSYNPAGEKLWAKNDHHQFKLNDEFYATGGGIFQVPEHYTNLLS